MGLGAIHMNKIYLTIAGVVAVLVAGLSIWLYVSHQDAKIDELTKTVSSQAIAIEQGRQTLNVLRDDMQTLKALTDAFNAKVAGIQFNSTTVTTTLNSKAYQNAVKADPGKAATDISAAVNGLFSDVSVATRGNDAK